MYMCELLRIVVEDPIINQWEKGFINASTNCTN